MTVKDKDKDDAHPAPSAPPGASLQLSSRRREFPDPFYCPITEQLLDDPVVIPDGDSYERSAIPARGDVPSDNQLYSNRALKSIIDEAVQLSGGSMRAGLKRFDRSVRSNFQQLWEKSALPSPEYRPLPEAYYCSITFHLMHDPVIDPDGNTYERVAIENWIRINGKSPATRSPLTVDQLYPNHAISNLLDEEKNRSDDTMHPSIRKFKAELPPQRNDAEMGGGNLVATTTTTTTASRLPTTQAEIDALRDRPNENWMCSAFCVCLAVTVLLILFVPMPYSIYYAVGLCICFVCFSKRQAQQRRSSPRRRGAGITGMRM
jgi:hypothetical protein